MGARSEINLAYDLRRVSVQLLFSMMRFILLPVMVFLLCPVAFGQIMGSGNGYTLQPQAYDLPAHITKHCMATRMGEGLLIGANVLLAGAGCVYVADHSKDHVDRPAATALLSLGMGFALNGAILLGAGKTHEYNIVSKPSNSEFVEKMHLNGEDYWCYYGPRKYHCDATKIGEGMLIGGSAFMVGAGIMALMGNQQDENIFGWEVVMYGAGSAAVYYGLIVFGAGKLYDVRHNRFSVVGRKNTVGLGYNF
jgi:hypothetical protein